MSKVVAIFLGLFLIFVLDGASSAQTTQPGGGTTANQDIAAQVARSGIPMVITRTPEEAFRVQYPTLQSDLGVNDADYAVLMPKFLAIRQARSNLPPIKDWSNPGGLVRPPPRSAAAPPVSWRDIPGLSPVMYAWRDLIDATMDKNTPEDVMISKLQAFRAAVAKSHADLRVAMENLRPFVNLRQEAVLVSYGLLD